MPGVVWETSPLEVILTALWDLCRGSLILLPSGMAIEVIRIQRTPNPNARKFVTPSDSPMPIRSFFTEDQAIGDPLASALFSISGVTNILIHTHFICVNKSPDSQWATVERAVKAVLSDAR